MPKEEQKQDVEQPPDVAALREEIEKLEVQSQHNLDQWKRTAANLENYRKRAAKERGELLKLGQATLIAQLLPTLDDLERAFLTLPTDLRGMTWIDGLTLIERKMEMLLEQFGLKEIEALGTPFDPALHQSILQEQTQEHPDGQVLSVLQKGYTLNDKVLRPAMVKIARNDSEHRNHPVEEVQTDTGPATEDGSVRSEPEDAQG